MSTDRYNKLAAEVRTLSNAARDLHCDVTQVNRWVNRGLLELVLIDGKQFVTRASVARLAAQREAVPV